uniref:Uncharacterized protein n=1 Tax=Rhizophora mucronata TaxID=61149 RepID=A0A2P2PV97_RHIMU
MLFLWINIKKFITNHVIFYFVSVQSYYLSDITMATALKFSG